MFTSNLNFLECQIFGWTGEACNGAGVYGLFRFTKSVTVLMFMIAVRVTGTEVPKQAIDKVMCQSRFPSPIDMA